MLRVRLKKDLFLLLVVILASFVVDGVLAESLDERVVIDEGDSREFDGIEAAGLPEQSEGGAIYNNGSVDISNSTFSNNQAGGGGAILNNEGSANISDSTFNNNLAVSAGGAINNAEASNLVLEKVSFHENQAYQGGALSNAGNVDISNSTFSDNSADGSGAAIFNNGNANISNSTFSNNLGSSTGGAVHNDSTGNLVLENVSFQGNRSYEDGAIYNSSGGIVVFKGDNTFKGNKASGQLNDIYNGGEVTVSGNMTLDGGISGTGSTTFENNSHLTVKAGATSITGNDVFNQGATLHLNVKNGFSGDYELIVGGATLDNEFSLSNNNLYNVSYTDTKGTYTISRKSDSEIAEAIGASIDEVDVVLAIIGGESPNDLFNKVADDISGAVQLGDSQAVRAALDATKILSSNSFPMIQQTQLKITEQMFDAIDARLNGGSSHRLSRVSSDRFRKMLSDRFYGMSSGDVTEDATVWVQGLANHTKLDKTTKSAGLKSDGYGAALGLEKKFGQDLRAGIGYAYITTEVDSKGRDIDIKTHGLYAYGEYRPNRLFLNGIISYDWSDYEENKNVLGNIVNAKYDVNTLGMRAVTGFDFSTRFITITPEVGLRYLRVNAERYVDSAGQDIASNKSDILTGLVGSKIRQAIEKSPNLRLVPEVSFGVTYDLKQTTNKSNVILPNGLSYNVNGENLSRFGVEVGVGLAAEVKDNVEMSVNYKGRFRKNYQDHSGLFNLKCNF